MLNSPKFFVFCGLAAAMAVGTVAVSAQESSSIQGAWIFTSEDGSNQRGLLIFTEQNYSMMFVNGGEPRAEYDAEKGMTDEETLAAYNTFVANSGRYTIEGDQVTIEAYMAKDPNFMAQWGENATTITLKVDGDTMVWVGGFGPAGAEDSSVTLRRVG